MYEWMVDTSERISTSLQLDAPPVALSFVYEPPEAVATLARPVPSSCTFWREAQTRIFYAPAEEHFNCLVGAMVMGFELPPARQTELGGLVQTMAEQDYLDPAEASEIPTMAKPSAGILYGPLAEFPVEPDLVLLWLTPRQAMLFEEAVGAADWTKVPMTARGRPTCAALPLAKQSGKASLSFGCMGMRVFTEVADDRLLAAVPGDQVADLTDALDRAVASNQAMRSYYEERKAAVAGLISG
jgi:uncharacterized protein (DUF169 family)